MTSERWTEAGRVMRGPLMETDTGRSWTLWARLVLSGSDEGKFSCALPDGGSVVDASPHVSIGRARSRCEMWGYRALLIRPRPCASRSNAQGPRVCAAGGSWVATTWTVADDDTSARYPAEANARLIAASPDLAAVLMRLARSADALLGACNAADVGGIEDRKAACRDIADAHNVIQAAGLYGGGQ